MGKRKVRRASTYIFNEATGETEEALEQYTPHIMDPPDIPTSVEHTDAIDPLEDGYSRQLMDKESCPIVQKCAEDKTITFCSPQWEEGVLSTKRFHFTTLRWRDSGGELYSYCDCGDGEGIVGERAYGPKCLHKDDGPFAHCPCAQAIIEALSLTRKTFLEYLRNGAQTALVEHSSGVLFNELRIHGKKHLAVKPGKGQWGLVVHYDATSAKAPLCLTCRRHKHSCEHVGCLEVEPEIGQLSDTEFDNLLKKYVDPGTKTRRLQCKTTQQIPENIWENEVLASRLRNEVPLPGQVVARMEECGCEMCNWEASFVSCTIFGATSFVTSELQSLKCKNCGEVRNADGGDVGVLNFNNRIAFCWSLLQKYSVEMMQGQTFHSFVKNMLECYKMASCCIDDLPWTFEYLRASFQDSWFDYVSLQKINYKAALNCCAAPTLVADGLMLAYKAHRCNVKSFAGPSDDEEPRMGSQFADRVMIRKKSIRDALFSFTGGTPSGRYGNGTGLSSVDHVGLMEALQNENLGFLNVLCREAVMCGGVMYAVDHFRLMLFNLSTTAPCCRILPNDVINVIEGILEARSLVISCEHERQLASCSPDMLEFLQTINARGEVPSEIWEMLSHMVSRTKRAFIPCTSRACDMEEGLLDTSTGFPEEDDVFFLKTGQLFGDNHCLKRRLHRYKADNNKGGGSQDDCAKSKYVPRQLTPGTFILFCATHEIAVGFAVMSHSESPQTPFEILFSRWNGLQAFCYDNACNLEKYALNREPEHFQGVRFLIDAMHYKGHNRCCTSYCSAKYPEMKNSAMAEQANARLDNIKVQGTFMSQFNFLIYVRHFIYQMNKMKKENKR